LKPNELNGQSEYLYSNVTDHRKRYLVTVSALRGQLEQGMMWENVASLPLLRKLISELLINIVHMYYDSPLSLDVRQRESV